MFSKKLLEFAPEIYPMFKTAGPPPDSAILSSNRQLVIEAVPESCSAPPVRAALPTKAVFTKTSLPDAVLTPHPEVSPVLFTKLQLENVVGCSIILLEGSFVSVVPLVTAYTPPPICAWLW